MGLYGADSAKPKSQTAQGKKQLRKAKSKSDEAKQVKRLGKPAKTTVMPLSSPEPVYLLPLDTPEEPEPPLLINSDNQSKSKRNGEKQKTAKKKEVETIDAPAEKRQDEKIGDLPQDRERR